MTRRRVRWLSLAPPGVPLRRLAIGMGAAQYSRTRRAGFQLDEVRRDFLRGRFIERLEWDEALNDPAGGEVQVRRLEVRQVRFRISAERPQLELLDPPRSLGSFVEQLSGISGQALRFSEVPVTPDAWLQALEARLGRVAVTGITAAGVVLSPSTNAAVAITGSEDVRRFLPQFARDQKLNIERIVAFLTAPVGGRIELLVGGRAGVLEGGDLIVDHLREGLRASMAMASD